MADRPLVSMAQQFTGLPMGSLIGGPLNAAAKANAAMAGTQTKFILDTCFNKLQQTGVDPVDQKAYNDADPKPATPPAAKKMWVPKAGGETLYADDAPADSEPIMEYKPIMITMSLTRGVITPGSAATPAQPAQPAKIQNVKTTFRLPLITIIPINSLGVDNVDINFEMEVKSSFSEDQENKSENTVHTESSFEAKVGYGPFSASVSGSASYDHKDSQTHSTHYQKSNSAKIHGTCSRRPTSCAKRCQYYY